MKYLSIDIETTGLDPSFCQVLELAVVADDLEDQRPLDQLPKFHTYVMNEPVIGQPFALAMNRDILYRIAKLEKPHTYFRPGEIGDCLISWLTDHELIEKVDDRLLAAGKNFGSFDLQFLIRLPNWRVNFKHRFLDPAPSFMRRTDTVPPNLQQCLGRAGIDLKVPHDAMGDALLVVSTMRAAWNLLPPKDTPEGPLPAIKEEHCS